MSKSFSELVEQLNKRSIQEKRSEADDPYSKDPQEDESKELKPRAKGERDFKDAHKVDKKAHVVASDDVFTGSTKPGGPHKGHEKAGEPITKQGSSDIKVTHDGSKTPDKSKAIPKRFGDLRVVNPIKEEVELDEVTVANAAKAFDIKKQAVALKAKIAKLKNTPGDAAHMKMIDAKRSFDKKIAALQALDVDAYEIKKLKESSLDEAKVDLEETAFQDIQKIAKSKREGRVKFATGRYESVDPEIASALVSAHGKLNSANKQKFEQTVNKDFTGMMKMVDFAMSNK